MSPDEEKIPVPEKNKDAPEQASSASASSAPAASASASSAGSGPAALVGVLTGVCVVAGVALAGGHAATHGRIAKQRYRFKLASVIKVLPKCDNDPGADTVDVKLRSGKSVTVYRCRKGGKVAAVAFSVDSEANKNAPYSGVIEVLVGIETTRGSIFFSESPRRVGALVLKHSETPGLGAKIEGFDFLGQYGRHTLDGQGRSCVAPGRCRNWTVTKDDAAGLVDAISGATISSRAVTEIVKRALTHYSDPGVRAQMTGPAAGAPPEGAKGTRPEPAAGARPEGSAGQQAGTGPGEKP